MHVPLAWLREFVDLPSDAQAVAHRLAMIGFPVAEVIARPLISGVVAGRISELQKHPNADRLQVARVDVSGGKALTIVTAATNVAQGQTIGVATIGAKLPALTIAPRSMRGIASEGMMVSAEELALPGEWFEDGIMQLDRDHAIGSDVVAHFLLDEPIFDVEVTGNRVDAMSILGLARELAASYDKPMRSPSFENPGRAADGEGAVPAVLLESDACTNFVAQRFDGISIGTSPAWMRVRLALAGQRPINSVVDISNYVMLETGQPLHFYDASKIRGSLRVRDGREGERLVTLDGAERALTPRTLVVSDDERALGIAGVIGGQDSEVTPSTTAIVMEAATFAGARIRRNAMDFGIRTEASSRHEKTLAPALAQMGAARAATLLVEAGASAYRPRVVGTSAPSNQPITLRARDVERLLGLRLPVERIAYHLESLGSSVETSGEILTVTPPVWRSDLTIAADLIEEVARMEGYDRIEAVVPFVRPHGIISAQYELESHLAHTMAALGYREIVTRSMHGRGLFERAIRAGLAPSHQSVEIRNPLSEETRYLRYALGPAMIEHFATVNRPERAFEIGHVFMLDEGHVQEMAALTFGFTTEATDEPGWHDSAFLRLKGDCEALVRAIGGRAIGGRALETSRDERNGLHPGKTAVLMLDGREVAAFGKLDPRLASAYELRLNAYMCNLYLDALPEYANPHYVAPSKFPSTYRDLALVVPLKIDANALENTVARSLGTICTSARAFDEYRGPQVPAEHKSLAIRVVLQRFDRTITDEEADVAVATAVAAVRDEFGAYVRE